MVLVTVHGDGKSKTFGAATAEQLLPAVALEFGQGLVTDASEIVLTAGYGNLQAGNYYWTAPAATAVAWISKVEQLTGLSMADKGLAMTLLLGKPVTYLEVLFSGSDAMVTTTIREIINEVRLSAGLVTTRFVLSSQLPTPGAGPAGEKCDFERTATTFGKEKPNVGAWETEKASVLDLTPQPLHQVIMANLQTTDNEVLRHERPRARMSIVLAVEVNVVAAMKTHALDPLNEILQTTHGEGAPQWSQEYSLIDVCGVNELASYSNAQGAPAAELLQVPPATAAASAAGTSTAVEPVASCGTEGAATVKGPTPLSVEGAAGDGREEGAAGGSSGGGSRKRRQSLRFSDSVGGVDGEGSRKSSRNKMLRVDAVLMKQLESGIKLSSPEAQAGMFLVGEFKKVKKLEDEQHQPYHLVGLNNQKLHASSSDKDCKLRNSIRNQVIQVNTYMAMAGVQYGYMHTWIMKRVGENGLRIAGPYSSCTAATEPASLSTMAALAYLQQKAYQQRHAASDGQGGDGPEHLASSDAEPSCPEEEEAQLDRHCEDGVGEASQDDGAHPDSFEDPPWNSPSDKTTTDRSVLDPSSGGGLAPVIPRIPWTMLGTLDTILETGCTAMVVRARVANQDAAVKMVFCCAADKLMQHEAGLYMALQELWGDVLPHLLGIGRMQSSTPFLVTSLVPGTTLADLPHIQADVVHAATRALSRVHAAGACHGDLTLANLLLVSPPPQGSADAEGMGSGARRGLKARPRVVIIDFGCGRLGASRSAMDEERQQLHRLLCT